MTVWLMPRNPWEKPKRISCLSDVPHKAQMPAAATALDLVYTPVTHRHKTCVAGEVLNHQIAFNTFLEE